MKIYGPYTRKDGRKHVIYYDFVAGIRRTVSYPKHLMQQHLGRELKDWETVDHIDEDFTNDNIDNLQVLSRKANAEKSALKNGNWYCCAAINCVTFVYRSKSQVKDLVFCSNSCRGKTYGVSIKLMRG